MPGRISPWGGPTGSNSNRPDLSWTDRQHLDSIQNGCASLGNEIQVKEAVLGRRDISKDPLIRSVGACGISHYIEEIQNLFPIGEDPKEALPLTAGFSADEIS